MNLAARLREAGEVMRPRIANQKDQRCLEALRFEKARNGLVGL
jgi:hypothetical protein